MDRKFRQLKGPTCESITANRVITAISRGELLTQCIGKAFTLRPEALAGL